jgi:ATP-dependent DNA helicase RecG
MMHRPEIAAWWNQPLRSVVGGATAKALASIDVRTAGELLDHLPRRYGEHGELSDIGSLQVGEQATVLAEVSEVSSRRMRQRKGTIVEVVVTDGRHRLSLTFFNQPWRARQLASLPALSTPEAAVDSSPILST